MSTGPVFNSPNYTQELLNFIVAMGDEEFYQFMISIIYRNMTYIQEKFNQLSDNVDLFLFDLFTLELISFIQFLTRIIDPPHTHIRSMFIPIKQRLKDERLHDVIRALVL